MRPLDIRENGFMSTVRAGGLVHDVMRRSVYASGLRDVLEQCAGELTRGIEPFLERAGGEKSGRFLSEDGIARIKKTQDIDRRGQPKASKSEKSRQRFVKKNLEEILSRRRPVRHVFRLPKPVETFRFPSNLLIDSRRRRTRSEALCGFLDELRSNSVMIVEDAAFSEKRRKPRRMVNVFRHRRVFAVSDIDQPIADPHNLMTFCRAFD